MTRYTQRQYVVQVALLMAAYIVLTFWLWPHLRDTSSAGLKVVFSLSPVVPVAVVVALMARRVVASDELEQRIHLIALGVATAVVGTASFVGGFLALAKVWVADGSVLVWVFPALCGTYGVTHVLVKRRYTGIWDFWGC